jgi:hypothetical protein
MKFGDLANVVLTVVLLVTLALSLNVATTRQRFGVRFDECGCDGRC